MELHALWVLLTTIVFLSPAFSPALAVKHEKILLSKVRSLTLRKDRLTSHRRVSAAPQLKCIAGDACSLYSIDVLRCTNAGAEYGEEDIQWTCTASLPPEFKLGGTDVICEGFAGPDDPNVLKGSCGVEYSLWLTERGEEKYGRQKSGRERHSEREGSSTAKALFFLIFASVTLLILRNLYLQWTGQALRPRRRPQTRRGRNFGGSGGGGDGPDDDDPPPPYDHDPYKQSSSLTFGGEPGQTGGRWRPGFWSGMGAGAAAGYAAGRAGSSRRNQERQGWGGGGSPSRNPGTGPSFSSSRYESSGFGGTSRR